jgi:hypothetical protein
MISGDILEDSSDLRLETARLSIAGVKIGT